MLAPDQLRLFWFFAMPGIIILYVRAQFLAGRLPPVAEGIIANLVVSVAYHAVLFPMALPLYGVEVTGVTNGLLWFIYILLGPAAVGLLLGLNVRHGWLQKLMLKAKLNTVHAIDSAWDWRFAGCEDCWVMVVLKNDTRWRGYLGERSFMSSSPLERDIYIEKVYTLEDGSDDWVARDSGLWIAHGEIQTIEFWPKKKD